MLVTRGNVDLEPILATLPYDDVVIYDGSRRSPDLRVLGRYLAVWEAKHETIYFQDDDLLFTAHDELRAAHRPGRITTSMPSPWYETSGYRGKGIVQVAGGALCERSLPWLAIGRYFAAGHPCDETFLTYCDDVVGSLCPALRVDLGYEILPHATAPGRISTTDGNPARRDAMTARLREVWRT